MALSTMPDPALSAFRYPKPRTLEADTLLDGLHIGSHPWDGELVQRAAFDMLVLCARDSATFVNERDVIESYSLQTRPRGFDGFVFHAPMDDSYLRFPADEVALAQLAAESTAAFIAAGKKVLVTCAAGRNRSGLVCALALRLLHGWSGSRAMQHVRHYRVNATGPVLSNPLFAGHLSRLKETTPKVRTRGKPPKMPPGVDVRVTRVP